MPGINDSTFVHGVIDLIDFRLKNNKAAQNDNMWDGTPSVFLFREHPLDEWVLTSARLVYPSGSQAFIVLNRGMTDEEIAKALENNKQMPYSPAVDANAMTSDDDRLPAYNLLPANQQVSELFAPYMPESGSHGTYAIEPTIPLEVDGPDHWDYEWYKEWRLKNVVIEKYDPNSQPIERLIYHMVYDLESRLIAALVETDMEW